MSKDATDDGLRGRAGPKNEEDSRGGTEDGRPGRHCDGSHHLETLRRSDVRRFQPRKSFSWPSIEMAGLGREKKRRKERVLEKWEHFPPEHEQGAGAWDQTGGCELNKASAPHAREGTYISAGKTLLISPS